MHRKAALAKAQELAKEHAWGPDNFNQSASFQTEEETKNFIELQGGGYTKLTHILLEHWYTPYFWEVRHYKEYEALETTVRFMPDGTFYGFEQKIPEAMAGEALEESIALEKARQSAQQDFGIDFSNLQRAEVSHETKPNGRIDYTFVYERTDTTVNNAPFRVTLTLSGDSLTQISKSIKVPESFTRDYAHMRSANTTLGFAATFFMIILYLFGGCMIGIWYLGRRHALQWRIAFIWAFILSSLQLLNGLNQLPLIWMHYNTALSTSSFLLSVIIPMVLQWVAFIVLLTVVIAVAEGLTRLAFPDHIQLWKIWSDDNARSYEVVGRTLGGYLIIGFDLAFIIGIYYFASRYLGWWTPSESLFNPDILAAYAPWLNPIAHSLNAGFMEECLFRAIPLAGAFLVGRYYKHPNLFLVLAFIVQALIFGAAHANYPTQPAYARLVELIIPSFVFGYIYLAYGLFPAILSHTVFDIFWFALPLFITTTPSIFIQQSLVLSITFIPVLIIIFCYIRTKKFIPLTHNAYNKAWRATPPSLSNLRVSVQHEPIALNSRIGLITSALGVISLIGWLGFTRFEQDNKPIVLSAPQAKRIANAAHMPQLNDAWQNLRTVVAEPDEQHRFIWRTNKQLYHTLLGSYLMPATWHIRRARFDDAPIAQRAEEYNTYLSGNGSLLRLHHQVPEGTPGESLSVEQARTIALTALTGLYNLSGKQVHELSATSAKKPDRLDWTFTFSTQEHAIQGGEPRITITLAGDEVVDHYRSVFIPETWLRADKQEQVYFALLRFVCIAIALFAAIIAGIYLFKYWGDFRVSIAAFSGIALLLLFKVCVQSYNLWPTFTFGFETSEPYYHQVWKLLGTLILQTILQVFGLASLASLLIGTKTLPSIRKSTLYAIMLGGSVGIVLAGLQSFLNYSMVQTLPLWADYHSASAAISWLSVAMIHLTSYIVNTILLSLFFFVLDRITLGWRRAKRYGSVFALVFYVILLGITGITSFKRWVVAAVVGSSVMLLAYVGIVRSNRETIPFISAAFLTLAIIQQMMFNAYPGVLQGSSLAIIVVWMVALGWSKQLDRLDE
jgi:hypothetical protein